MQEWVQQAEAEQPDEIWFVEHDPVFTLGQAGDPSHILNSARVPVVHSDRGGQVTYHGPGQMVVYFLLSLQKHDLGPKALVHKVENLLIDLLQQFNIEAIADSDKPGLYVEGDKIASLGFRIRRGHSYHGIALNVDMDLTPFDCINPCGYQGLHMTQMKDLLHEKSPSFDEVKERFRTIVQKEFEFEVN